MNYSIKNISTLITSFKWPVSGNRWSITGLKNMVIPVCFKPATLNLQAGIRRFPRLIIVLASLFLFSAKETGCRKTPDFGKSSPATETRSPEYLKKKLRSYDHKNLNLVNAQAKVFMEGNGQSIGAIANISWIRDSVMWMNVKKFGLEAARVLVTQDSVFVLNRLEKTYSAKGLESLQRQYSLPAGFDLLQSLLLASPWYFPDIPLASDIKDGKHRLSGSNGRFSADYRVEEEAFWLNQELFLQPRDTRSMSVLFENYKKTELAGWFPYLRTLEASSPETGDMRLSIEISEVEFNVPKSIRFEIPRHYEKVD
jgi:hypothetical protein